MSHIDSQQNPLPASEEVSSLYYLPREGLQVLIDTLVNQGFEVVGPRISQGAITYDRIDRTEDLPEGWTDVQSPGKYRLKERSDRALFGYVVGPHSWKKYLFPPMVPIMTSKKTSKGWEMREEPIEEVRYALLGVRACELAAIAIQDQVFLSQSYVDPIYSARRKSLLIVAVNCTQAASTCFCTSMGTGPRCSSHFDLALTELSEGFLVEVGSDRGNILSESLPLRIATTEERRQGELAREQALVQITRRMETNDVPEKLLSRLEHPHWDDVAHRCLSCANCTLVCPTCFCSSVDDVTDLTNEEVLRQRHWDSCFHLDFSHLSGQAVRNTIRARYRQWLTHKLASWVDQFGTSGCVGCGRCITWCPVGIDLTQEVASICCDVAS